MNITSAQWLLSIVIEKLRTRSLDDIVLSSTGETFRFDFPVSWDNCEAKESPGGQEHPLEHYGRALTDKPFARAKLKAVPRFLWNILRVLARCLRPYILIFGGFKSALLFVRWMKYRKERLTKSWYQTITLFTTAMCFRDLVRDTFHEKDGFGAGTMPAIGLHAHSKSQRLEKALRGINRTSFSQCFPIIGGDMQSVLPGILAKVGVNNPLPSMRIVPMRILWTSGREAMAIDWIVGGAPCKRAAGIALLLPGVGGGSRESYIQCIAKGFLEKSFAVLVLHPRGLGPIAVSKPENMFDMADTSDLAATVQALSDVCNLPIDLLGFSMGAIICGKYCSTIAQYP